MGNLDHGAAAINFVKQRTEGLTHIQEIEINDNGKVPKSFQSYLGNSNNKYKCRETLPCVLTFSQIMYLTNLDGATDRVTS